MSGSAGPARPSTIGDLRRDEGWSRRNSSHLLMIGLMTFGILALELSLIRWMSGQIRMFAYFTNVVLIAAFVGMALGLLAGPRTPGLVHFVLPGLALLALPIAFSERLGLVHLRFPDPSLHLWGAEAAHSTLGQAGFAFSLIWGLLGGVIAVFFCAGAPVGYLLSRIPGVRGYSADLLGSLLGVLVFAAVTAADATPTVWLLVGGLPFLWVSRRLVSALSLLVVLGLAHVSVAGAIYSPYNRIDIDQTRFGPILHVNRDFHQQLLDLHEAGNAATRPYRTAYDLPFVITSEKATALIAGAGGGNDVQAALRNGFQHVVSVDIDGTILDLGRRLHPEKPYGDPRVVTVTNDARAFFEQYRGEPFDVVCYGLVDSHAMLSALSTLRLDNYLYTEEGLRAAWRHVKPTGVLTVSFSLLGGPWIRDRLYWTLARATGVSPVIADHGTFGGATFIAAKPAARVTWERAGFPTLRLDTGSRAGVRTTSDDWPFIYLRPAVIPWGYIIVLTGLLTLSAGLVLLLSRGDSRGTPLNWPLFLMGAAFLLLETRAITSLSLLFGSTWVVNATVFAGILAAALGANLIVQWGRIPPRGAVFGFLMISLVVIWSIDLSLLNRWPLLVRSVAAGLMVGLPVGAAGLIVSTLISKADNPAAALASNLLGSVLGGCLEYLSMYVGLRSLVLLALALYLCALLVLLRGDARSTREPAGGPGG